MNIIPNLPILHSKKTVGKFVFTQNYLQSHKTSTKKSNKHKPDINELDDEPTDTNTKVKNSTKSSKNSRPKNSSKNNNDSTTNQSIDPYYEE